MTAPVQRDSSAEKGQARLAYLVALVLACLPALGVPILPWTFGMLVLIVLDVLLARPFVGWHGMQALVLVVLPVVLATKGGATPVLFCGMLTIASLFLILGLRQAGRGRCWLLHLVSPQAELPRPWAVQAERAAAAQRTNYQRQSDGYRAFLQGQSKLGRGMRAEAVLLFAQAYREGNPVMRSRALEQLERLDEVESF